VSFENPEDKNGGGSDGTTTEGEKHEMKSPEFFDVASNSYITKEEHDQKIKEKLEDPFGDASK